MILLSVLPSQFCLHYFTTLLNVDTLFVYELLTGIQNDIVCRVTSLWAEWSHVWILSKKQIYLFCEVSRWAVGPTQAPAQLKLVAVTPGGKMGRA